MSYDIEKLGEEYADYKNDYVPAEFGNGVFNEEVKKHFINGFKKAGEFFYTEEQAKRLFEIGQMTKDFGDYKPYTFDEAKKLMLGVELNTKPIRIIYYEETTDNWGRKEASTKPSVIHSVLITPENFNGDMSFESSNGNIYDIDELIGKEVIVDGFDKFIVTE